MTWKITALFISFAVGSNVFATELFKVGSPPSCAAEFAPLIQQSLRIDRSNFDSALVDLNNAIDRDSGPSPFSFLSKQARLFRKLIPRWIGVKPYWPAFQAVLKTSNYDDPDRLDRSLRYLESATSISSISIYDAMKVRAEKIVDEHTFFARHSHLPVKCRYSDMLSTNDIRMVTDSLGAASGAISEVLQVRLVLEGGDEITVSERRGDAFNVEFSYSDIKDEVNSALKYIGVHHPELKFVKLRIVHTHPHEPMKLLIGETIGESLNDLSENDIISVTNIQQLFPLLKVEITAIIGIQPGLLSTSTYGPKT